VIGVHPNARAVPKERFAAAVSVRSRTVTTAKLPSVMSAAKASNAESVITLLAAQVAGKDHWWHVTIAVVQTIQN